MGTIASLDHQVGKQYAAIQFVVEKGKELQQRHPEIAEDYRKGSTLAELVVAYDVPGIFNLREHQRDAAVQIVYRALVGNRDWWGPRYAGLLSAGEARRIGRAHIIRTARANGQRVYERRIGVHAATPEERRAYASRAGKIGGARVKELGVGYCGLTAEQRRAASQKGMQALGLTPWEQEELALLTVLCKQPEYRDPRPGFGASYTRIAAALNATVHAGRPVRTRNAVGSVLRKRAEELAQLGNDAALRERVEVELANVRVLPEALAEVR